MSGPRHNAVATCKRCGEKFSYYHCSAKPKRVFCSKSCFVLERDQNRKRRHTTQCKHCGITFDYMDSQPRRVFCSKACSGAFNAPDAKVSEVVTKPCACCGVNFTYTYFPSTRAPGLLQP